jgi:hypothetical protein
LPGAGRSEAVSTGLRRAAGEVGPTWRALNWEQRAAGIGALLLIVSTFGPFSFVEAAIILVGVAVLALLRARAVGKEFHLPFGDGAVIAAAGAWSGLLIVIRLFDRPLGQNLLALACAGILVLAGLREKAKRPPDDLPTEPLATSGGGRAGAPAAGPASEGPSRAAGPASEAGEGNAALRRGAPGAPQAVPPSEPRSAAGRRAAEEREPEQLSLPDRLAPPKPLEPPEPPGALGAGRKRPPPGEEEQ